MSLLLSTQLADAGDGIVVRFANREHILNIRNNSPSNAINSIEVYDVQANGSLRGLSGPVAGTVPIDTGLVERDVFD
jgi:hypothetical protein